MINKENLEHWKNFASDLVKEIAQFKAQNTAPVNDWPMSVNDLPENENLWWTDNKGRVKQNKITQQNCAETEYATEADAKSALAFAQLSRLIRHINKGWEPDFVPNNVAITAIKYSYEDKKLHVCQWRCDLYFPHCLYFKSISDAERSRKTHRSLWLQYFQVDEQEV